MLDEVGGPANHGALVNRHWSVPLASAMVKPVCLYHTIDIARCEAILHREWLDFY
jgi:hypothetical protein